MRKIRVMVFMMFLPVYPRTLVSGEALPGGAARDRRAA